MCAWRRKGYARADASPVRKLPAAEVQDVMHDQHITFTAKELRYEEALGGDIVQISFDEDPTEDPLDRTKRYFLISQNYEFPGKPTVEWHDGIDYDGGSEIVDYVFTKNLFEANLKNGLSIKVHHSCSEDVLMKIQAFLKSEYQKG